MSSTAGGPLANYNSLTDRNLSGYFGNTRMKKHLMKSGLINSHGQITSQNAYKMKIAKKEHREHVKELLANAIVEKALDMERMRQFEIRKKLNELYKIELVSKVRSERYTKNKEELYALLSPRSSKKKSRHRQVKSAAITSSEKEMTRLPDINFDERTKKLTYETTSIDSGSSSRFSNPKPPPSRSISAHAYGKAPHPPPPKTKKKKKRKVHRGLLLAKSDQMVAHRVQVQSMAEVTMKFLGSTLHLTNDMFPANKLSEIQVIQQHCGASTVCLFREMIPPNTVFTFVSRRHRGSPFGLTINIDGIKNIRISSCCEYKHKPGFRLGGKNSQFGLISVQGAAPCYRCQVRLNLLDHNKKEVDREKEASSDEEAATRSFDIIVSRGGKRQEVSKERPISASVTTQTESEPLDKHEDDEKLAITAKKEEDDYNDDFFEDEDEEGGKDKMDDDVSSSSSESDSDASSDSDDDKNNSDDDDKDDDGDKDDNVRKKDSSISETDDKDETTGDAISDREKSIDVDESDAGVIKAVEDNRESEEEDDGKVKRKEDDKSDSDNDSDKGSDTEKQKRHSSSSESDKSDDDDKKNGSSSSESENENDDGDHVTFDRKVEDELEEGEGTRGDDNENGEHIDLKEEETGYLDSEDEEGGKKGASVSSAISRESTMLTGNEDGRCDSENKTIQFNEEVDVLHFEKVDVESAAENTPRSDESYDEDDFDNEDFDTIKSGGERVVLADLGDDDVEEDVDDVTVKEAKEEVEKEKEEVEQEDGEDTITEEEQQILDSDNSDSDYRIFDKGSDPGLTDINNNDDKPRRQISKEPIEKLIGGDYDNVDLVDLELSNEQTEELVDLLEQHANEIELLSFRNVKMEASIKQLKDVMLKMSSLKVLNLNENDLRNSDVKLLSELLRIIGHNITSIGLSGNPIGDDGLVSLLNAANNLASLTSLDIGRCEISEKGAAAMLDFFTFNTTVTELIISGNKLTNNGWTQVANMLKNNKTLQTISVDSCFMKDDDVKILCEGIGQNGSLKCCDIENNVFTDEGGLFLIEAVEQCKTLLDITLEPNAFLSQSVIDKIRILIESHVQQLDL